MMQDSNAYTKQLEIISSSTFDDQENHAYNGQLSNTEI